MSHGPIDRRTALLGTGAAVVAMGMGQRTHAQAQSPASQDSTTTAPRPTAAQQGAGFYRFRVGEVECFAIGDAGLPGQGSSFPTFGSNATKDEVDALTRANFQPASGGYSYFNVLLLRAGRELVLVDTGFGEMVGPNGGWLERTMATLGFAPADVSTLVFSHLHPDHFGGYTRGGPGAKAALRFPNARVLLHERELAFWNAENPDLSKNGVDATMRGQMVGGAKATLAAAKDRIVGKGVGDGHEVAPGVRVVEALGHTPGHIMLQVASGDEKLVMISDLVHHYAISFQKPEWFVAFDTDPAQGAATRRRVLGELAKQRTLVMGYHTPWPGVGYVQERDGAFAWVPANWRW